MSEKEKSQPRDDFSSDDVRKIPGVDPSVQNDNERSAINEDSTQREKIDEEQDSFKDYSSALSVTDPDSLKTDSFDLTDLDQPSTSKGTTKGSSRGIHMSGFSVTEFTIYDPSNINLVLSGSTSFSTTSALSQFDTSQLTTSMNSMSLCAVTSQSEVKPEITSTSNAPPLPQRKRFALAAAAKMTSTGSKDSNTQTLPVVSPVQNTPLIYDPELKKYVPLQSGDIVNVVVDVHSSHDGQEGQPSDQQTPFTTQAAHQDQVVGEFLNQAIQVPTSSVGTAVSNTAVIDEQNTTETPRVHAVKSELCINSRLLGTEIEKEEQVSFVSPNESIPGDRDSQCELLVLLPSPDAERSPDREWVESPSALLPKRRHSI